MAIDVYQDFLDYSGFDERGGQREAVRLLVELAELDGEKVKDGEASYALQAPTGTGKSFAALLAGVHCHEKGLGRVVIGTTTVVLSEQYENDMVVVNKYFPNITFSLLKGASHYYCGNKAGEALSKAGAKKGSARREEMMGALYDFRMQRRDSLPGWASADPEYCIDCMLKFNRDRSKGTACEYTKARVAALSADVVVTTHAMISVDLKQRMHSEEQVGNVLGPVHMYIFDEAHKAAQSFTFSESMGRYGLEKLYYHGCFDGMTYKRRAALMDWFSDLDSRGSSGEWRWCSDEEAKKAAQELLDVWPDGRELISARDRINRMEGADRFEMQKFLGFLNRARGIMQDMVSGRNGGTAGPCGFWETRGQYRIQEMVPESGLLQFLQKQRVAWLSATLGTESKKTYSLTKVGIYSKLFKLPGEFDYKKQLKWTVRTDSSAGKEEDLVLGVNSYIPGGCAVLTPFHNRKRRITDKLIFSGKADSVEMQSDGGAGSSSENAAALSRYKEVAHAGGSPVLVGVEIFSTGIDLPGAELTKLIVAGLFPLRDDRAYIAWRGRWLSASGGNGFDDYELPERAIMLEQQIGRLIRRTSDKGLLVLYLEDKDWTNGSAGERIVMEAIARFEGAIRI